MDNYDTIKEIVERILGAPRQEYEGSGGWWEYNCPACADENFGVDNRYNLAVNYYQMYFHCWKCLYSGKLSKLIREYGNDEMMAEYKSAVVAIRDAHAFEIKNGDMSIDESVLDDYELELPDNFRRITNEGDGKHALAYLRSRGIGDDIIERYNIGYIGSEWINDYRMRERVVIPSYNAYGSLNYYIARDYTGQNKRKIFNPDVEKTSIIFNEEKINWYEPITIVEGPFDHIVTPNSIPMLGSALTEDSLLYRTLMEKAISTVNIMLDYDATEKAKRLYKKLESTQLRGRVRIIECPNNDDDGYDPADIYRDYGKEGIIDLLRSAHQIDEFDLQMISTTPSSRRNR